MLDHCACRLRAWWFIVVFLAVPVSRGQEDEPRGTTPTQERSPPLRPMPLDDAFLAIPPDPEEEGKISKELELPQDGNREELKSLNEAGQRVQSPLSTFEDDFGESTRQGVGPGGPPTLELPSEERDMQPLFASLIKEGMEERMEEVPFIFDENVVVSPAIHNQEIGLSPSAITVLTREDIITSGATAIVELLRQVPGLEVSHLSNWFSSANIRFSDRGNRYLLVLIDGREANFELLGLTMYGLQPIFVDDIERIEVIRGPGSFLYGANAFAGVVSITTRAAVNEELGAFRLELGEAGSRMFSGRLSQWFGRWRLSAGGGVDLAGQFADPRAAEKRSWKLRTFGEYRISDTQKIQLEGDLAAGNGLIPGDFGTMDNDAAQRTLWLGYKSSSIQSHLSFTQTPAKIRFLSPLLYKDLVLARLRTYGFAADVLDGEFRYQLPTIWASLLLIVGASGRISWMHSDELLDGRTYADPASSRYHQPGIDWREVRGGAYTHAELKPARWVTLTGGIRVDHNNVSKTFLSPRAVAVFEPWIRHFFRLEIARSFRKPSFMESGFHVMLDLPKDSLLLAFQDETATQELMSRLLGNPRIGNEKLLAYEAGYAGRFLDSRLHVNLDLYYYVLEDYITIQLDTSEREIFELLGSGDLVYRNRVHQNSAIKGAELSIQYRPSRRYSWLFTWSHRDNFPRNHLLLGGRFRTRGGFIGSLYASFRSGFMDSSTGPEGFTEPQRKIEMDPVILWVGKIGWRAEFLTRVELETGLKLLLPMRLASGADTPFYFEKAGGYSRTGQLFGGEPIPRRCLVYLQGTF